MLWRICNPKWQKVKGQSEVIFNEERDACMWCWDERNDIDTDVFGLAEAKQYTKEIATRDEPLQRQDSQRTQLGKRCTSDMPGAPDV